jgi:hypothetical protein
VHATRLAGNRREVYVNMVTHLTICPYVADDQPNQDADGRGDACDRCPQTLARRSASPARQHVSVRARPNERPARSACTTSSTVKLGIEGDRPQDAVVGSPYCPSGPTIERLFGDMKTPSDANTVSTVPVSLTPPTPEQLRAIAEVERSDAFFSSRALRHLHAADRLRACRLAARERNDADAGSSKTSRRTPAAKRGSARVATAARCSTRPTSFYPFHCPPAVVFRPSASRS